MIQLSPTEIAAEYHHGRITELEANLRLLADYLGALAPPLRAALTPLPWSDPRERALMVVEMIPAWRAFVRGMADRARKEGFT